MLEPSLKPILPATKEELIQRRALAREIGIRYVKDAVGYVNQLKDVYTSNGLGDVCFERIGQAQELINNFEHGHVSDKLMPRNAIEYNILIERESRDCEEYLGQFVPSVNNFIRRLLTYVESHLAHSEGNNSQDREKKKALDALMKLHSQFAAERRQKLLIADY